MPCCSEISFIVLVPGRNDAGRRAHGGGEAHPVPEDAGEEEEAEASASGGAQRTTEAGDAQYNGNELNECR